MAALKAPPSPSAALPLTDPCSILPAAPTRSQIDRLEKLILRAEEEGDGLAIAPRHYLVNGLIAREIIIPQGTLLTGVPHRFEHLNFSCGDITVWTEQGMRRIVGFEVVQSMPGCKRVGFAHAETRWVTVHANPLALTAQSDIEDYLVEDAHKLQNRRMALIAARDREILTGSHR